YRVALGLPHDARGRLRAFAPHIVHIAVPDVLGWCALRFARRGQVSVVASYHTRCENYLKHYGLGFLSAWLARYLDSFYDECRELYVPSASMAEVLAGEGIRTTLRLWPRGVDMERFHPDKRSDAWRVRHGIGVEDVVVISVGRLVREKQLDVLCEVV